MLELDGGNGSQRDRTAQVARTPHSIPPPPPPPVHAAALRQLRFAITYGERCTVGITIIRCTLTRGGAFST